MLVPFILPLPTPLSAQGWKVKIQDRERVEPPHATIIRGTRKWRYALREGDFLDDHPDPADVPAELLQVICERSPELRAAWDERYPENPITAADDDDERS